MLPRCHYPEYANGKGVEETKTVRTLLLRKTEAGLIVYAPRARCLPVRPTECLGNGNEVLINLLITVIIRFRNNKHKPDNELNC